MNYDSFAIPDEEVPKAADPVFQHLLTTYASETNKTVSMWKAVPDDTMAALRMLGFALYANDRKSDHYVCSTDSRCWFLTSSTVLSTSVSVRRHLLIPAET